MTRPASSRCIEPVHNAVSLAEIAAGKDAKALLLPVNCRRQLFDLSDDMATKLDIEFYQDAGDALSEALANESRHLPTNLFTLDAVAYASDCGAKEAAPD